MKVPSRCKRKGRFVSASINNREKKVVGKSLRAREFFWKSDFFPTCLFLLSHVRIIEIFPLYSAAVKQEDILKRLLPSGQESTVS